MPNNPTSLRPGKEIQVNQFHGVEQKAGPSYNPGLNTWGVNLNNSEQFKVFEKRNGVIQSQNQTLFAQDVYDPTKDNNDLQISIAKAYKVNARDRWELLPPWYRINYPQPSWGPNHMS